jgi:hypothetical protein
MYREHPRDIRITWVAFGWFAAASVTGLGLVLLISLGVIHPGRAGDGWVAIAVAIGFFSGGWLAGWRNAAAPILQGVAIGLFTVVIWVGINLVAEVARVAEWDALTLRTTVTVLIIQIVFAVAGAWYGGRHHAVGA